MSNLSSWGNLDDFRGCIRLYGRMGSSGHTIRLSIEPDLLLRTLRGGYSILGTD